MQAPENQSPKRAYTEVEAARYIGLSRSFLRQSRMHGTRQGKIPPPKFIKMGKRKIVYLAEDLDEFLEQFQKAEHLAQLQQN